MKTMLRAAAAAAALLIGVGVVHAQSQQAIREQVFGETDAVKERADDLDATVLAPETYAGASCWPSSNGGRAPTP